MQLQMHKCVIAWVGTLVLMHPAFPATQKRLWSSRFDWKGTSTSNLMHSTAEQFRKKLARRSRTKLAALCVLCQGLKSQMQPFRKPLVERKWCCGVSCTNKDTTSGTPWNRACINCAEQEQMLLLDWSHCVQTWKKTVSALNADLFICQEIVWDVGKREVHWEQQKQPRTLDRARWALPVPMRFRCWTCRGWRRTRSTCRTLPSRSKKPLSRQGLLPSPTTTSPQIWWACMQATSHLQEFFLCLTENVPVVGPAYSWAQGQKRTSLQKCMGQLFGSRVGGSTAVFRTPAKLPDGSIWMCDRDNPCRRGRTLGNYLSSILRQFHSR